MADLVVVLTGLGENQLTVRHLRPQMALLRLALTSTRLLSPRHGPAAGGYGNTQCMVDVVALAVHHMCW